MADRENVINELNECIEHIRKNEFDKIPFWGNCQSAMMDALELLKEQPHWISVEERLPTYSELKNDCVLVLFDDGTICSTGFDECIDGESIFGEWRQNFDPVTLGATGEDWIPLQNVTHWMPLPKPPGNEELTIS